MDARVIQDKLEALRHCVQRVQEKCPASVETLLADADLQDIVTLNLTRAVQLSVDMALHLIADTDVQPPETMAAAFESLSAQGVLTAQIADRPKKAVGFRNVAVHNYEAIDWRIVHSICRQRLDDFREFAKAISAQLDSGATG